MAGYRHYLPGLGAPTESINVTGALGVTSFLYFIISGFRQQGIRYLKHFTGGLSGAAIASVETGSTLVVSAPITGAVALRKERAGTLVLSGNSAAYGAAITINQDDHSTVNKVFVHFIHPTDCVLPALFILQI